MSFALALRLATVPERAWPDVRAACTTPEGLPAPFLFGGVPALLSVLATTLGQSTVPNVSVQRVIVWTMAALAGYFGAFAAVLALPPDRLGVPESQANLVPRFVVSSALPIAASGTFNFVPVLGLTFIWTVLSCALAARCAWVGAKDWLGLDGEARLRATTTTTVVAVVPVLLLLCFRALFET